jgi:RNA polymerase sporulation-specific sigma factor
MKSAGSIWICRYERLRDQAIIRLAQAGDVRACEYLLYKYRNLVRTKSRSYFLADGDKDDLLQIGMIGLWQSIMDYSPESKISFLSFARICVERHIISAVKASTRMKQSPLNNAVSLDFCLEEGDTEFDLSEILTTENELDPEEILLRKENVRILQSTLKALLSDFEWQVLKLYRIGRSYQEIARQLECNTKSVDNALGRIKRKVSSNSEILAS